VKITVGAAQAQKESIQIKRQHPVHLLQAALQVHIRFSFHAKMYATSRHTSSQVTNDIGSLVFSTIIHFFTETARKCDVRDSTRSN